MEILKLRGLSIGYKEVEEMLISGSVFFEKDDNKNGLIYARIRPIRELFENNKNKKNKK